VKSRVLSRTSDRRKASYNLLSAKDFCQYTRQESNHPRETLEIREILGEALQKAVQLDLKPISEAELLRLHIRTHVAGDLE
jgi:hypothetical protein